MNVNIDPETGIHYGVISIHSVGWGLLDDIYMYGVDNILQSYIEELQAEGKSEEEIDEALDSYSCDGTNITYEDNDYKLWINDATIMVIKSPHCIRTRFCSPCYPNAGDLDTPDSAGIVTYAIKPEDLRDDL